MNIQLPLVFNASGSVARESVLKEFHHRCDALDFALTGKKAEMRTVSAPKDVPPSLGEMLCPPSKRRGGRKADPNSAFQRVSKALHEVLASGNTLPKTKCYEMVLAKTGLPGAKVSANINIVKGIKRTYGYWTLQK